MLAQNKGAVAGSAVGGLPVKQSKNEVQQFSKGAIGAPVPLSQQKHTVHVKGANFEPAYLKVERGSIVEWVVLPQTPTSDPREFDIESRQSHVIAFSDLPTESPVLREHQSFRVRFLERGVFNYQCQIYPRMKGRVEVVDKQPNVPIVRQVKDINSLFKASAGLPKEAETCLFKKGKTQNELGQRLIEVLEEEKDLSIGADTDTPMITKEYFEEVFVKYNKVLKCDAELSSDHELQSEDQEEIEAQEKRFIEEQRESSKNSNLTPSSGSKQAIKFTPFSLLFHTQEEDLQEERCRKEEEVVAIRREEEGAKNVFVMRSFEPRESGKLQVREQEEEFKAPKSERDKQKKKQYKKKKKEKEAILGQPNAFDLKFR